MNDKISDAAPVFFVEDDFGLWKITDEGNYSFWKRSRNKKVMKLFGSSGIANQISVMADEIEGAIEALSDGDAQSAMNSLNRVMELVKGVRHE